MDGRVLSLKVLNDNPRAGPERPPEVPGTALEGLERLHLIMGFQCNARCSMCYQTDFSPKDNMTRRLYAERLASAYRQVRIVKLQGGEPTVMHACRELAGILEAHPAVGLSMSTNGLKLEGFWHEALLRQGRQVDVSLNAATAHSYARIVQHGNFSRVVRNVGALAASRTGPGLRVAISAVILKENFGELHQFVGLARELGVDAVKFAVDPILSFAGLPPPEAVRAELDRVDEAQHRTGMPVIGLSLFRRRFLPAPASPPPAGFGPCRVPQNNLVIGANGDVRSCVRTWQVLGNLNDSTLEEIWNNRRAGALRRAVGSGDHSGCEAWCPENRSPSRLALLRKYAAYAGRDPGLFARKLHRKVTQLWRKAA